LGCKEALMCLGDKPEVAFPAYRATLAGLGHRTTAEYVYHACAIALDGGLLPHTNAGLLSRDEMARLKEVNVSLGLMLENVSPGLNAWGGISPLTPDYVNPEAPWPHVATLAATCRAAGYTLAERLAIYPAYVDRPGFLAPALCARVAALGEETRTAPGGVEASA